MNFFCPGKFELNRNKVGINSFIHFDIYSFWYLLILIFLYLYFCNIPSGMLENFRVAEDMPIESDIVVGALDKVNTHTYVHTDVHTCLYTNTRTCTHVHTYKHMYIHICAYAHIRTDKCTLSNPHINVPTNKSY